MSDTPIGTDPVSNQTASNTSVATPSQPSEPTVYDLSDESLIRIKGAKDPVKFSEYGKGFQSQFTRASQKAAQLEKALAERDAKLQQLQAQAQSQSQSGQKADVFEALRKLPYLSGEDAVGVVQSIGEQIKQRDHVLLAALQKIQSMERTLGGLNENHVNSSFDQKINRILTENNLGPKYADLAKEIYLAYEGDDLDAEFPTIFSNRIAQLRGLFEEERTAKVRAARPAPFVPGRGGQTGPSKPLQLDPRASARDVADTLWDSLQSTET